MTEAVQVILAEHDSIGSVLACLRHTVAEIEKARSAPDFRLLRSILDYLETFPEIFHHSKEEEHLFKALRHRRPEAAPLLDRLREEHILGLEGVIDCRTALRAYQRDPGRFAPFKQEVDRYVEFEMEHMQREEREVLPLAMQALTPEDWRSIDAAFARNDDPLFGARRRAEFEALYDRILTLAPEPMGFARRDVAPDA